MTVVIVFPLILMFDSDLLHCFDNTCIFLLFWLFILFLVSFMRYLTAVMEFFVFLLLDYA